MFCSECGTENKQGTRFCEQCGKSLGAAMPVLAGGKPLGIVIIVNMSVLSGVAEMAVGSVVWFVPHLMSAVTTGLVALGAGQGVDASVHIASLRIAGIAVGFFASGVLTLAAAYGLWNFIGWGRVLAVILYSVGLFVGIILFFTTLDATQTAGSIVLQLLGFAVTVWILIYLFRPNIRELFHGSAIPSPSLAAGLRVPVQNSPGR